MKYVMLKQILPTNGARLVPIVFPDCLVHSDIVAALKSLPGLAGAVCFSAGDVELDCLSTTGRSETLELEANEEDANVIDSYDYLHGLLPDDEG